MYRVCPWNKTDCTNVHRFNVTPDLIECRACIILCIAGTNTDAQSPQENICLPDNVYEASAEIFRNKWA